MHKRKHLKYSNSFILSVCVCFVIFLWSGSTQSQKSLIKLFIHQAIQGNIDFSMLQQTMIQTVEISERPLNEINQVKKLLKFPNQDFLSYSSKSPAYSYLSEEKHLNLSSCSERPNKNFKHKEIYQWKDHKGHMHLSDRFPAGQDYHDLVIHKSKPDSFFTLNLDSRYSKLPPFASDRMKRDVNQIYTILIKNVGVSQLNPITLNLKLFDDKGQFIAYKREVAPRMGTAGGFYISSLNEATVYTGKNKQRMYDVTRHEATHAIVSNAFGKIPTWLNEGLAEYFEKLTFDNSMLRSVEPNNGHLRLLFNDNSLPSLVSYLSLTNEQWYAESRKNQHYAMGWSIVYFLMSSKKGKRFLSYMLDHLAHHYCQSFSDIDYINKHYSGGLPQFEKNWKLWLFHAKKDEHRF